MKIRKFKSLQLNLDNKLDLKWNPKFQFRQYWYILYSVLVPSSEKFIIRSSSRYLEASAHSEKVKLCFGQEANHAKTHKEFSSLVIREFRFIKYFTKIYTFICYRLLERFFSNEMKLVIAAATEQLNTCLAIETLRGDRHFLSKKHTIKEMLDWHFLEEIEHREIIFDLMIENSSNALYRVTSMIIVFLNFILWPTLGTILIFISHPKIILKTNFRDLLKFCAFIVYIFFNSSLKFCSKKYHPKYEKLPEKYFLLTNKFKSLEI